MSTETPHGGDCDGSWCDFCGCCMHGNPQDGIGCRASFAPYGMRCPGDGCGCEGSDSYEPPTQPPDAAATAAKEVQLHQAEKLFDLPT